MDLPAPSSIHQAYNFDSELKIFKIGKTVSIGIRMFETFFITFLWIPEIPGKLEVQRSHLSSFLMNAY